MKQLQLYILLFAFQAASATNYYVSSNGSDAANGLTQATSWLSISKVNVATFSSGDSILFRRGDVFYGGIKASRANLNYGAYGTGAKPIITGLSTITGWVNLGGNIWEAATSGVKVTNNLVIRDGVMMQVGRFPNPNTANGGYLTYTTSTAGSITGSALSSVTNWTGSEVAIRLNRWSILRKTVISHSAGTVSFATHTAVPKTGYGYFFQRDSRTLDQDGEWFQNGSTNKLRMYFGNNNPNVYLIQAATVDTLFSNPGFLNNIVVSNLQFIGGGVFGIYLYSGSNHVVKGCETYYSGREAISVKSSVNVRIDSCLARNSLGSGIRSDNSSNNTWSSITNCTVDSTALIAGMEMSAESNNGGEGITNRSGTNVYVTNNIVTNSGFCGITWYGNNAFIKYNLVDTYCKVRDDGAGIYTSESQTDTLLYATRFNRNVVGNIVLNGIGNDDGGGASGDESKVNGLYCDDGAADILIDSNTTAYIPVGGVHGNDNRRITFTNNTTFQTGFGFSFQKRKDARTITGMVIKKNIFYPYRFQYRDLSRDRTAFTTLQSLQNLGTIDSNYYSLRTGTDTSLITVTTLYNGTGYEDEFRAFSYITGTIGKETNSTLVATGATLEYNASNTPRVVTFTGLSKKDAQGNVYDNSVTIPAWGSKILIANGSVGVVTTPTTTTLTSSVNPTNLSGSTTFTATVNSSLVTGSVVFKNGAVTLATVTPTSGVATFSTSGLTAGTHSITATYGGDSSYDPSVSNVVTQVVNVVTPVVVVPGNSNNTIYILIKN